MKYLLILFSYCIINTAYGQLDQKELHKKLKVSQITLISIQNNKIFKVQWNFDGFGNTTECSEYFGDTVSLYMQWRSKYHYDSLGEIIKKYTVLSIKDGQLQNINLERSEDIEIWITKKNKEDTTYIVSHNRDGSIYDFTKSFKTIVGYKQPNKTHVKRTDLIYDPDSSFLAKAIHQYNFSNQYLEYKYYDKENQVKNYDVYNYNSKGLLTYKKEWDSENGTLFNSYYSYKYDLKGRPIEITELDAKKNFYSKTSITYYQNSLIKYKIITKITGEKETSYYTYLH